MDTNMGERLHCHLMSAIKQFCTTHIHYSQDVKVDGTVCLVQDGQSVVISVLNESFGKYDSSPSAENNAQSVTYFVGGSNQKITENGSAVNASVNNAVLLVSSTLKIDTTEVANVEDGSGDVEHEPEALQKPHIAAKPTIVVKQHPHDKTGDDFCDSLNLCADDQGNYRCPFCVKNYAFKHSLRQHVILKHAPKQKKHTCKYCGQNFGYNASLLSHVKKKHYDALSSQFQCPLCQHRHINEPALKQHFTRKHPEVAFVGTSMSVSDPPDDRYQNIITASSRVSSVDDLLENATRDMEDTALPSLPDDVTIQDGGEGEGSEMEYSAVQLSCGDKNKDSDGIESRHCGTDVNKMNESEDSSDVIVVSQSKNTGRQFRQRKSNPKRIRVKTETQSDCGMEQQNYVTEHYEDEEIGTYGQHDTPYYNKQDSYEVKPLLINTVMHPSYDEEDSFASEFPLDSRSQLNSGKGSSPQKRQYRQFYEKFQSHDDKTMFKCIQCDKIFKSRSTIIQHLHTHFGVKSYVCTHCGECFTYRGSLHNHVMYKHAENREAASENFAFQCQGCAKKFKYPSEMRRHYDTHPSHKSIDMAD